MLPGAGLGDDPALAHAPGEQDLADGVVDLVSAGVGELVALEVDAGAAELCAQALGQVERRRAAGVVGEPRRELRLKSRIVLRLLVGALQLEDQRHQGLGDEAAAVDAEPAARVRAGPVGVGKAHGRELTKAAAIARLGRLERGGKLQKSAGSSPGP